MKCTMDSGWTRELALALFVLGCAYVIKIWWSRRRLRELSVEIPGPPTIPLLGNIHQLIGGPQKLFTFLRNLSLEYQDGPFCVWIGPKPYVIINSAEDAEIILIKQRLLNRDKYLTDIIARFVGNGLLTCRADVWKMQRKFVAPAFGNKIVETYSGAFNKQASILVNKLEKFANGDVFDVYERLVLCTFDMICESSMGIDMNAQDDKETGWTKHITNALHVFYKCLVNPWLNFDTFFYMTNMGKEEKHFREFFYGVSEKVIHKKLQEHRENKILERSCEEFEEKTLLDYVISFSENEIAVQGEKQLRDELVTLILAGLGTSATTMSFILMMFALHPELQEEVVQEIKDLFADDWERSVTTEDVKRLPRLDRFIKETMRLFPAIMGFPREIPEEVKLSTCTLPAGSVAVVFSYSLHRDPRFFPDPERFDPDRFLFEQCRERHSCSYLPFGAGPRMCVGYKYAELQMTIVLATVLRKYRVLPAVSYDSLQQLEISMVLQPSCGFLVKMLPR